MENNLECQREKVVLRSKKLYFLRKYEKYDLVELISCYLIKFEPVMFFHFLFQWLEYVIIKQCMRKKESKERTQ